MSDCHSFDVEVAKELGLNAAVIFKSFCFWLKKNASEDVNFKDGCYWSFASIRGLSELFPYLTEKQIRTAIECLVEKKYLKKAQLSDNKTNRTLWYSLDEKGESICQIGRVHLPKKANGAAQMGKSNIEDKEKNIRKEDTNLSASLHSADKYNPRKALMADGIPGQVVSDWLALRKRLKAEVTKTAVDRLRTEAGRAGITLEDALRIMCANGWRGFQAEWVSRSKPAEKSIYEQSMEAAERAKALIFGGGQ